MRSGRCSSSSSQPIASCLRVSHVCQALRHSKEKRTVAYALAETLGSPFSTLFKVILLIEARSTMSATGMRRRRASRMSWPSLRRTRVTGMGTTDIDWPEVIGTSTTIDIQLYSIPYSGRK